MFISVEVALYVSMRSDKKIAKLVRSWLLKDVIPRGFDKIIEEKDTQLALLNGDLTEAQENVKQLEYSNTGLQGEIRAKNQEIARR